VQYYQVSASVRNEETLLSELRGLEKISDHNPKYLITLDDDSSVSYNGIRQINILDFLTS